MMTVSGLAGQVKLSSQSSSRQGATVDTFLIHHQAGTNDDAVIAAMVSGSRGVSANYTINSSGRITPVVPENLRAHTSGSPRDSGRGAAWDRRSITVEIENESGAPEWRISDKAIDAAARLLADLRTRYRIVNVLGHRDLWDRYRASYSTFCPGPDTVARIVNHKPFTEPSTRKKRTMTTMFVKTTSSPDKAGGKGSLWAMAGDAGTPCPGNWVQFTRDPADGGLFDRGSRMAATHGNAIMLTDAEWETYKALYATPAASVAVTASNAPVLAAIADVREALDRPLSPA